MFTPETKFLIVSADDAEGRLIRSALEHQGYLNLTQVKTGEAALELMDRPVCDVLIAAWDLPNGGGLSLVKHLRKKPHTLRPPCFVIVPNFGEKDRLMVKGAGVLELLTRPLTESKIVETINQASTRRPEADQPGSPEAAGDVLFHHENPTAALSAYREALAVGRRRLAGIHTEMGLALKAQGRKGEAIGHLKQAVQADPHLARAHSALGLALMEAGKYSEAEPILEQASGLDPDNDEVRRQFVDSLLQTGQNEKAEEKLKSLLTVRPDDLYLLNRIGIALRKQGKFAEAVKYYLHAIDITDRDDNLYFNLGRCYYDTGEMNKARSAFKRAIDLNPGQEDARKMLGLIDRGQHIS